MSVLYIFVVIEKKKKCFFLVDVSVSVCSKDFYTSTHLLMLGGGMLLLGILVGVIGIAVYKNQVPRAAGSLSPPSFLLLFFISSYPLLPVPS